MPLPVKRKLRITQGATFNAGWTWKPGGVPADFTGCRARMQVRPDIDSPAVLLELTTENGGIVLGATPGGPATVTTQSFSLDGLRFARG